MLLQLADHLEGPLRDHNPLMLAAGFAPHYGQRGLDEPEMGPVREALDQLLAGHQPLPALVYAARRWLVFPDGRPRDADELRTDVASEWQRHQGTRRRARLGVTEKSLRLRHDLGGH